MGAFMVTYLMACFDELPFFHACWLLCPVLLNIVVDRFAARDLPQLLLCAFDVECWQVSFELSPKQNNDIVELATKLACNCVLAASCALGSYKLHEVREKEK